MSFRPQVLSYENLRDEAEGFIRDYHDERTLPVPIEAIVEFDFELEIVPMLGLKQALGVDAFLTGSLERIFVDEEVMRDIPVRYRFSLAHELAHYLLHQDLYRQNKIESVADWRRIQQTIGEDDYGWFEYQANSFAGLVLMPSPELRHEFNQAARRAAEAGVPAARLVAYPARQHLIANLAKRFVVSEQALERRLELDHLLPKLG